MLETAQSDEPGAPQRRLAVTMFRAGQKAVALATQLQRSRRWVYYWVAYQRYHPHTHFRSESSAPRHHPSQTPRPVERQVRHLRQSLLAQRNPRLRYAPTGARTIRRELSKRRVKPCPSLSTIQRSLRRHGLTAQAPTAPGLPYRPHPSAPSPNAVHATDIITRWLEGGTLVQTFTTVDHFSNAASATIAAEKRTAAARAHLLATWQKLGVPVLAQFDNESVFSGGPHPQVLSATVRLCLYLGIEVLFTPIGEADYNWQIETVNHLWATQFWDKHRFPQRWRIPPALQAFLCWYNTDYVAPRQQDTPTRLRAGQRLRRLPKSLAARIPESLPISAGLVQAVRCVSANGQVTFLKEFFPVGKRYRSQYVWLTLDTAKQSLTVYSQAQAEADWRTLKVFAYPLAERVAPVLTPFACLHA
jgi:hypothetical protein